MMLNNKSNHSKSLITNGEEVSEWQEFSSEFLGGDVKFIVRVEINVANVVDDLSSDHFLLDILVVEFQELLECLKSDSGFLSVVCNNVNSLSLGLDSRGHDMEVDSENSDKVLSVFNLLKKLIVSRVVEGENVVEDSLEGVSARQKSVFTISLDRVLVENSGKEH
jgi:hypothetical protein